jgi:hypothetical protein
MRILVVISLAVAVSAAVVLVGDKATRARYQRPQYRIVEKDRRSEMRDYPALIVADTSTAPEGGGLTQGSGNEVLAEVRAQEQAEN